MVRPALSFYVIAIMNCVKNTTLLYIAVYGCVRNARHIHQMTLRDLHSAQYSHQMTSLSGPHSHLSPVLQSRWRHSTIHVHIVMASNTSHHIN